MELWKCAVIYRHLSVHIFDLPRLGFVSLGSFAVAFAKHQTTKSREGPGSSGVAVHPYRAWGLWTRAIRNVCPAKALSNPPSKNLVLLQHFFAVWVLQPARGHSGQNFGKKGHLFPKSEVSLALIDTSGRGQGDLSISPSITLWLALFATSCSLFAAGQSSAVVHKTSKRRAWSADAEQLQHTDSSPPPPSSCQFGTGGQSWSPWKAAMSGHH